MVIVLKIHHHTRIVLCIDTPIVVSVYIMWYNVGLPKMKIHARQKSCTPGTHRPIHRRSINIVSPHKTSSPPPPYHFFMPTDTVLWKFARHSFMLGWPPRVSDLAHVFQRRYHPPDIRWNFSRWEYTRECGFSCRPRRKVRCLWRSLGARTGDFMSKSHGRVIKQYSILEARSWHRPKCWRRLYCHLTLSSMTHTAICSLSRSENACVHQWYDILLCTVYECIHIESVGGYSPINDPMYLL